MGLDGFHLLEYCSILMIVAGFHGIFFYRNLGSKDLSWGMFQLGIVFWGMALSHREAEGGTSNLLAFALTFSSLVVFAGVYLALLFLCQSLRDKYGTLDGEKLDQEEKG